LAVIAALLVGYALTSSAPAPAAAPGSTGPVPSRSSTASLSALAPPGPGSNVAVTPYQVRVPVDFRYVVTSTRLLVLDLGGRTAAEVATFQAPTGEPGFPLADVSASSDGRAVLLTVHVTPLDASVIALAPERGDARLLVRGAVVRAVLSPSGSRFSIARIDPDAGLAGLWAADVGSQPRRLIADDPQYAGGPPLPYAFSPSGSLIAFGLRNSDAGAHAGIIRFDSVEARTDRGTGDWVVRGGTVTLLGPSSGAEFLGDDELFVWSSRDAFGGQTVAYTYRIPTKSTTELYRPSADTVIGRAAWRPGARGLAEAERPMCCGVSLAQTVRVVPESGPPRVLGEWSFLVDLWWSGDGSKLYGVLGGDDSTAAVRELLTDMPAMRFCWRGGTPGGCL
jgi:hypothetical protein